jgi:4-deoxy-L-threo-5-hexosulose-uronate ketol-isomerase
MKTHYLPSSEETATLGTEALRERFLLAALFQPGRLTAHYTGLDRMIVGAAMPAGEALPLPNWKETGTSYFLERREIGVINLGDPGFVHVGARRQALGTLDCLYVGAGERDVAFEDTVSGHGRAAFYFVSTPAHAKHPTAHVTRDQVKADPIGDPAKAARRRIHKCIHPDGIKSCQLVMGFTELEPGSVWNTMPAHVHSLGNPRATRHLIVRDREAVLSPSWSIHSGAGTGSYRFVWAMAGDNQVFSDMDPVAVSDLR